SGAGSLGVRALQTGLALRGRRSPRGTAQEFATFETWADELFARCIPRYRALACRDASTMNALLPTGRWPNAIQLRVTRGSETLGWAVVFDTQMQDDPRFGSLRVGSVVDALALPEHAEAVVGAAVRTLHARGVDIIFSNQAHPDWVAGFAAHGFLILPDRRALAASPKLAEALAPFDEVKQGLHLTNMDGHGPMQL
ncbi:MAG: hypothetical protein ACREBE_19210, partial [bacterium]